MKRKSILLLLTSLILAACTSQVFTFRFVVDLGWPEAEETVLPTGTVPATPTLVIPSITPIPSLTPTATITPSPTVTSTLAPTSTPQDATPTREVADIEAVSEFGINVRSAPNGSVTRTLPANTVLLPVARNGDWFRILPSGWVFNGSWIEFTNGSFEELPEERIASAQSRVGYNTLEVYDRVYYLNHLLELCPAYMLVMDNITLADEVYQTLHEPCGTEVIHRNWYQSDGEEFLHRTPQETVNRWIGEGYPHLIRYTTNEVSCGGNTPCSLYVAHEVEVARLARQAGFTVALGNMGVGKHSPNDVINGVYNPLVQAALDYDHILGFHEYTWGSLSFGFGRTPKEHLLDRDVMQPNLWSNDVQFDFNTFSSQSFFGEEAYGDEALRLWFEENPLTPEEEADFFAQAYDTSNCGELPGYWHMGRSFWILLWYQCSTGNQEIPTVVHTEWGWDYMADVNEVIEPLRNQYAHPQYEYNLRGWRSLEYLWRYYWPAWTTEQAAFEQIDYAIDLYPDNHYFLLFAWSDERNRDWTRAGFSFGNYGDPVTLNLHRYLEQQ